MGSQSQDLETGGEPKDVFQEGNRPGVVTFSGPDDPCDPQNWSVLFKWTIVGLISAMNLVM